MSSKLASHIENHKTYTIPSLFNETNFESKPLKVDGNEIFVRRFKNKWSVRQ